MNSMTVFESGYIKLYRSGELERRVGMLETRLTSCDICPRQCRVNRLENELGFCHSGCLPIIASACAHHGEEPALSGSRGSGTVFFANCNMRCVYCQNHQISQDWHRWRSYEVDCRTLAERMLYLQDRLGCHNINLVSPSHFVPQIVRAVLMAVPRGLRVPLVYNSNGYDDIGILKALEGVIDIYLPDLRYASDKRALEFSKTSDYVVTARAAIQEMYRQVGDLVEDESGVAQRGVIVRHLILPHDIAGSRESLGWLAREVSPRVTVSLMSQYAPLFRAKDIPLLSRTITRSEYDFALECLHAAGLENGWVQEMGSAADYVPDFNREGTPFASG